MEDMEIKAKNLINLQVALRAVGMNLSLSQIAAIALTMDKVQEVGDGFTTEMALRIGAKSNADEKAIKDYMANLVQPVQIEE